MLERQGLGTRTLPNEALRDPALGQQGAEVRIVCLSAIEGGSSLASIRYALRRLQRRVPEAVLILGAWGAERGGELLSALDREEGSHHAETSLRGAARFCLDMARESPVATPAGMDREAGSQAAAPPRPDTPPGAPALLSPA